MKDGQKLTLYTAPLSFSGITIDRKAKAIVLGWVAETEVSNIILLRLLVFKLGLPPIKCVTTFTEAD